MKLVCLYCSKEIVLESTKNTNQEEKLKGSIWFCSEYCKDTFVNIQMKKKKVGEREDLQ